LVSPTVDKVEGSSKKLIPKDLKDLLIIVIIVDVLFDLYLNLTN